ncbi:MAG: lipoprotein [Xanthomonadales bacterium]|nr:lipoprotein [Xanthomonadales bacterium]
MKRIEKRASASSSMSRFLPLLLCGSLVLAACGQRGPLYLPETPDRAPPPAPAETQPDASEDDDAPTPRA